MVTGVQSYTHPMNGYTKEIPAAYLRQRKSQGRNYAKTLNIDKGYFFHTKTISSPSKFFNKTYNNKRNFGIHNRTSSNAMPKQEWVYDMISSQNPFINKKNTVYQNKTKNNNRMSMIELGMKQKKRTLIIVKLKAACNK